MCVITNTHLASHGLTTAQYKEQFGELSKRLVSLKTAEALLPFGLGKYPDPIVSERSGVRRRDVALARARLSLPVVAGLYRTQEGVSCRSIVEAQFDAWLHDCDIDHTHQPSCSRDENNAICRFPNRKHIYRNNRNEWVCSVRISLVQKEERIRIRWCAMDWILSRSSGAPLRPILD